MSTRPQVDFKKIISDEGIPTTEEAIAIELEKEVVAAGSKVSNDSRMSPFWRLVKAIVITSTLWLIDNLLASHVLPNTFAATAKGVYLDLKAWDVDLERKEATNTRGVVAFFKEVAENPIVIPKGAVIETDRIEDKVYRLIVIEEVLISANKSSGLVLCEAELAGEAYNLPAGYYSILPIGITGITHVMNPPDWVTTIGSNEEPDDDLALRVRNQFSAVGRYHIDAIYRSMIASIAGIRSDQIYFEHNAPRGPGTANAYILLDVGTTPTHLLEQLNTFVMNDGNHGHGDDLVCLALAETQHSVNVVIKAVANVSDKQKINLQNDVEKIIRAAFRELADYEKVTRTTPLSTFSFSVLTKELHQELSLLYTLDFENTDIEIGLTIPRLSAVSVNYG